MTEADSGPGRRAPASDPDLCRTVVETARQEPVAVAGWLLADFAIGALMGFQDRIEARLRQLAGPMPQPGEHGAADTAG